MTAAAFDWLQPNRLEEGFRTLDALPPETFVYTRSTSSTNRDALAAGAPAAGHCAVYITEHQSDGQGRRGKRWDSALASGLCLSLAFRMPISADAGRLPLALGVGLRRALLCQGVSRCQLKWPNDLVVDGRKLGGLLISAKQLTQNDTLVVAGLGLNVHVAPAPLDDQALVPVALAQCVDGVVPDRTALAIVLINTLRQTAAEYSRSGFASFATDWIAADYLHAREVKVVEATRTSTGVAAGIDAQGRLLVRTSTGLVPLNGGEVSVRPTMDS